MGKLGLCLEEQDSWSGYSTVRQGGGLGQTSESMQPTLRRGEVFVSLNKRVLIGIMVSKADSSCLCVSEV